MHTLYLKNCRIFSPFTHPLTEDEIKAVKTSCSLRRADRFTSLAVTAVKGSAGSPFPDSFPATTGLITVSAFGPHKTVFATLDDILDFPEDMILPIRFSHSVHNAAAAYLGTILKITGPTFAVTGFESPLFEALELAHTLLISEMCPQILLIGIEERGLLTKAAPALDPKRFHQEPEEIVCAMLLTAQAEPNCRELVLERTSKTTPSTTDCTLGLSAKTIQRLAEPEDFGPIRLSS